MAREALASFHVDQSKLHHYCSDSYYFLKNSIKRHYTLLQDMITHVNMGRSVVNQTESKFSQKRQKGHQSYQSISLDIIFRHTIKS